MVTSGVMKASLASDFYPKQAVLETYIITDAFFLQPHVQAFNNLTEQLSVLTVSFAAVYNRSKNPVRNTILFLMRLVDKLLTYVSDDGSVNPPKALEDAIRKSVAALEPHIRLIPYAAYARARKEIVKVTGNVFQPTVFH